MHKLDLFINHEERDERGQSLVEFVLVLPIILVMIAGVLEVTNLILQYNNVQQAAREGARYAAGGGVDNGVDDVVLDTISNNLNEDHVNSIWIIRPKVRITSSHETDWYDQTGGSNPPWGVEQACVYPKPCTDTDSHLSPITVSKQLTEANSIVLDEFSGREGMVDALDEEILTVVVVNYRAQTILNLSFFDYFGPDGTLPLRAWTIMRQEIESETLEKFNSGCNAYPIAINLGFEQGGTVISGASEGDPFNLPFNPPGPSGTPNGAAFLAWNSSRLPEGNLYGADGSLVSPNADTYYDEPPSSGSDTSLHRDDLVYASYATGITTMALTDVLDDHIDKERALRVIGYNFVDGGVNPLNLNPRQYIVDEFLIIKVTGYTSSSLEIEFVRFDNSCGYDLD
jgi:hypothetical protein